MPRAEASVTISRPIDEVFAYVSDLRHCAEWQAGVTEVRMVSDGPPRVGSQFSFVREFMGRRMEARTELVAFEPNMACSLDARSDSLPAQSSYLFETVATGTKVTCNVQVQPRGLAKLATPLIALGLERGTKSGLRQLKDHLERRPAAG